MDNEEIQKYYLRISNKELSSDTSEKSFEIWNLIKKYRKMFGIGNRLIDVGCGKGKLAMRAVKEGYEVFAVDIIEKFLKNINIKEPSISTYMLNILDSKAVSEFVHKFDQFDIVIALGLVLNHASSKKELKAGLFNLVKLAKSNSLIVFDLMIEEMTPGKPKYIWSEFTHTLASFRDLSQFINAYGLRLLDIYSIHDDYGDGYVEHSVRTFIYKPW